jgi:aspartate-semialdehyde dehydrogenase
VQPLDTRNINHQNSLKNYRIGILGATGAVGQEIINLMEKREFPATEVRLLASAKSAGLEMKAFGNTEKVQETTQDSFNDLDFAIFSAGSEQSIEFAELARSQGCVVIDNSSAFRMDPKVPLVIPEINEEILENHNGIVANPNCSTAITLMGLYPLHRRFQLKRFFASTYQAVSGAGKTGLDILEAELRTSLGLPLEQNSGVQSPFPHPIAHNLIPHIDSFREDGYTKEEMKMKNETKKILSLPSLQVSCTCVRVPVIRSHSISINAEFENGVNIPDAKEAIESFSGTKLMDSPTENLYPTPIQLSEQEACAVGRLRIDQGFSSGLSLWVVGDQLWKGAALNAIQIAESMIHRNCLPFTY